MAYNDQTNEYDPTQDPDDPNNPANRKPNQPTQSVDYSGYTAPAAAPAPPPPAGSYDRNAFRDAWMGSGAQSPADLANFVSQHQSDFGAGVKVGGSKGDMLTLPDGTIIDAVTAAGLGGKGAQWMGIPSQMGGGGSGAGAPGAGGGGVPSAAAQDPMVAELLARLKGRADQSLTINASTDPNIRQQADPFAANVERQRRQYLNQQAEALGPNANLTNEARLTAEQAGQQTGQFEAGLVGKEIQARRQEIQDALTQMGTLLTDQQRLSLQKELAQLDDATKRYGISTSASTAQAGLSNDWAKALLNNDQFNARLGLDAENDFNNWNKVFTSN